MKRLEQNQKEPSLPYRHVQEVTVLKRHWWEQTKLDFENCSKIILVFLMGLSLYATHTAVDTYQSSFYLKDSWC
jgi:hypothetical protein